MENMNGACGPLGRGVPFALALAFLLSACGGGGGGGDDASSTGSGTASSGKAASVQLEDLNQDGKILLLAFGDSITAGVGDGPDADDFPRPLAGYPLRLQNLLGLQVINDGIPGEKTPTGLRRLARDLGSFSPDFVIILEGTNDLESGSVPDALQNIQSMIDSVFASGAQPLLGTITPSCCAHQHALPQEAIFFYNDQLRAMATSNSVPLIDFYAAFAGGPEASYPIDGIPVDGTPVLIHVPEGLHPTPAGYDLMAETARGIFKLPKPGSIPTPTSSGSAG
jgi:lysophospholipase L1-like esterase